MKCSRAQRLMSDHTDGLLKGVETQRLEMHMQECTDCSNLFAEMASLVQGARNLKKVEPSDDVWRSIENHLGTKNRKVLFPQSDKREFLSGFRYRQGFALASAAIVAVVVLTFLIFRTLPYLNIESNDSTQYALHHFEEAEKHYQLAIEALVRTMPDYEMKLSPQLAAVLEENLKIIDNSIRICQAAIQEHPGDKTASALLMACYKKKIELLNEIRDITMRAG